MDFEQSYELDETAPETDADRAPGPDGRGDAETPAVARPGRALTATPPPSPPSPSTGASDPVDGEDEDEPGAPDRPAGSDRLEVTGTQVLAGALASVSGALVASVFGVGGTLVGTGVGSVVTTLGGAFYLHGLRRTRTKLEQTPAARMAELTRLARSTRLTDPGHRPHGPALGGPAEPGSTDTTRPEVPDPPASGPRAWLTRRWGLAAGVALVFGISLAAVTTIEVAGQRTLARSTGGDGSGETTSVGWLLDGGGSEDEAPSDGGTSTTGTGSSPSSVSPDSPTTGSESGPDDDGPGDATESTGSTDSTAGADPDGTSDPGADGPATSTTAGEEPSTTGSPTTAAPDGGPAGAPAGGG